MAPAVIVRWGTMLIERNTSDDLERARDLLGNAHATAAAHGYANIERRAKEVGWLEATHDNIATSLETRFGAAGKRLCAKIRRRQLERPPSGRDHRPLWRRDWR